MQAKAAKRAQRKPTRENRLKLRELQEKIKELPVFSQETMNLGDQDGTSA